jgi:hypothetical protein
MAMDGMEQSSVFRGPYDTHFGAFCAVLLSAHVFDWIR